jgi:hypothetical protein
MRKSIKRTPLRSRKRRRQPIAPQVRSITFPRAANSAAGSLNTLASKISSSQIPSIAVPRVTPAPTPHQHGGIVLRPHVGLVGEAGPEAIIPIGNAGGMLGKMLGGITVNADPKAKNRTAVASSEYSLTPAPVAQAAG